MADLLGGTARHLCGSFRALPGGFANREPANNNAIMHGNPAGKSKESLVRYRQKRGSAASARRR